MTTSAFMTMQRTKILRDLAANKARTLLVVLSIAIGVAAFGLMNTGRIVLEESLNSEYAASVPPHSIFTTANFSGDLLDKVKALPEVQAVEGRRAVEAAIETAPDHWTSLQIYGVPDLTKLEVGKVKLESGGTFPPPVDTIILERTAADLFAVKIGQKVQVRTLDGKTHGLTVAGVVNDLSRQPTPISLTVYGYISLDTLATLGEDTTFNRLFVRLKSDSTDRAVIEPQISRVIKAVEDAGTSVYSAPIPAVGKQIMGDSMNSVLLILSSLGVLTLALSGLLIINIMMAVMGQQITQIGILKSIGGTAGQLIRLYVEMVLMFGIIGLVLAIPMGAFGAYFLMQGLASSMNFDVPRFYIPTQTLLLQTFGAIVVPLLAAAVPILRGATITVKQAIAGSSVDSGSGLISALLRGLGSLSQLMKLAIGNTFRRQGRLTLTLATLSLAGAMFIALIGIRQSLRATLMKLQDALRYDVSATFDRVYPVDQVVAEVKKVDGITAVETWGLADGKRLYPDGHTSSSIALIAVPADTRLTSPHVTQGRFLQTGDEFVLFVNADFIELAPDLALNKTVKLRIGTDERDWKIVGVGSRDFTPVAYIPFSAYEKATGLTQLTGQVVIETANHSSSAQAKAQSQLLSRLKDAQFNVVSSQTTNEYKAASINSLDILVVLLMSMVVLIAVVGSLGLAITMGLNVLERTREIGILRSLGGTNGTVRRVVIVEGLVIAVLSWAIGAVLSIPLAIWLGNSLGVSLLASPLDYQFSVPALIIWFGIVLVIAIVASLIPAQNAARLTIRDTLAYIG